MTMSVRPAGLADLDRLAELLLADAEARCSVEPDMWKLDGNPRGKILSTVKLAMEAEQPPFRQQWLVAEVEQEIVGLAHSILLPVPPIYAGELGPPGLIMEDCFVDAHAPPETRSELFRATVADLFDAGARVFLASSVEGGDWAYEYARQGFERITLYFMKTGLSNERDFKDVRPAIKEDVPSIVAASAINRRILRSLHPNFWKPHPDADDRFGAWMERSLTLNDRDMFVSDAGGRLRGYAISQPATPLHFPIPHDISSVGVIDDFFHEEIEDSSMPHPDIAGAIALLGTAEAARERRGDTSVMVVCPASWRSKIELLEQCGYRSAITWYVKMCP